jgi:hypothetical protein
MELKELVDIAQTGAMGILFFLLVRRDDAHNKLIDRVMTLLERFHDKVQLMEKHGILPPASGTDWPKE